jgi:hypothetical protein
MKWPFGTFSAGFSTMKARAFHSHLRAKETGVILATTPPAELFLVKRLAGPLSRAIRVLKDISAAIWAVP